MMPFWYKKDEIREECGGIMAWIGINVDGLIWWESEEEVRRRILFKEREC
jgi:hypothetical protein